MKGWSRSCHLCGWSLGTVDKICANPEALTRNQVINVEQSCSRWNESYKQARNLLDAPDISILHDENFERR